MPYRNLGGTGLMVSALSFGYASPQPCCSVSSAPQAASCGAHTCLTLPVMHSTRYKPRYGLLTAHRSVPRTMTLNDNPGGEIEGKITRGEEAYELLAAAYKGGVNVSAGRWLSGSALTPPLPRAGIDSADTLPA